METPTPKLQMLLFRLAVLTSDLDKNLKKLHGHFHPPSDDQTIVLNPAVENIVDKVRMKKKLRASWKVEMREVITDAIEFEELDHDTK